MGVVVSGFLYRVVQELSLEGGLVFGNTGVVSGSTGPRARAVVTLLMSGSTGPETSSFSFESL
jgi:hypothetical protein